MTAKSDYTDAEWTLLLSAMAMVGFSMMAVSRSGTIGKLRELTVLFTCLTTECMPPDFQQNELVMALVRDFHAVAPPRSAPASLVGQTRATSGIAAAPRTMIACCELVALILASKTPAYEAEGYKRWLMWIAGTVADATAEGWLSTRRKITREEDELLRLISVALRISPCPPAPTASELEHLLSP